MEEEAAVSRKRPFPHQRPTPNYLRIENKRGQLLFEFDPTRDLIRIKTRGMARPEVVDLAAYRAPAPVDEKPTDD